MTGKKNLSEMARSNGSKGDQWSSMAGRIEEEQTEQPGGMCVAGGKIYLYCKLHSDGRDSHDITLGRKKSLRTATGNGFRESRGSYTYGLSEGSCTGISEEDGKIHWCM